MTSPFRLPDEPRPEPTPAEHRHGADCRFVIEARSRDFPREWHDQADVMLRAAYAEAGYPSDPKWLPDAFAYANQLALVVRGGSVTLARLHAQAGATHRVLRRAFVAGFAVCAALACAIEVWR